MAAAAAVRLDLAFLEGKKPADVWRPATTAWIRANVPASALVQSYREGAVMLLTERRALPMFDDLPRDRWLTAARRYGVGYIVLDSATVIRDLAWLFRHEGVEEVYRNGEEDTLILRVAARP